MVSINFGNAFLAQQSWLDVQRRTFGWMCSFAVKFVMGFLCLLSSRTTQALPEPTPMKEETKERFQPLLGDSFPEGEKAIYIRVVESFRQEDLLTLYKFKNLLLKYYPHSIHADNALYLAGYLEYKKGRIPESIKSFSAVIDLYPLGNKRASALYAKSVAYSKLNLPDLSKKILHEVVKEYPGSPESQKAWIDLRILDQNQKKDVAEKNRRSI